MDDRRTKLLAEIVEASHAMLAQAKAGHWHLVAELEASRRGRVETFFATSVTAEDSADVAAAIREVLALNGQVAELGAQARNRIGDERRTHDVGDKARRAYRQCAARP